MKKFIYLIFVIFCLVCVSCEESPNVKSRQDMGGSIGNIIKIEFEGHTYLIRNYNGSPYIGYGGMCHDENCKCKKQDLNNLTDSIQ